MKSWFIKIKKALTNTASNINNALSSIFTGKTKVDQAVLEQLEEVLLATDIGFEATSKIMNSVQRIVLKGSEEIDDVKEEIYNVIFNSIKDHSAVLEINKNGLNIILFCGVNGNGKTTSIGKVASYLKSEGLKVALAACDTFRAAAEEQLTEWSKRLDLPIFLKPKADPSAVAYEAVKCSLEQKYDVLLIDTAGRLHNNRDLMAQLAKIDRVIHKFSDEKLSENRIVNYHNFIVLDGTTGQNTLSQVESFAEVIKITGIIVTKLDSTAKAGFIIPLIVKFKIPIYFLGVGEKFDDIIPFNTEEFSRSLIN